MVKKDKFDKLLKLFEEEDFCINDLLACICCNLERFPKATYETSLNIGSYLYNITITKGKIQ